MPDLTDLLARGAQEYLGDGVYASFDGYHIWLRTPREGGWHEVALEPPVFDALVAYRGAMLRALTANQERGKG